MRQPSGLGRALQEGERAARGRPGRALPGGGGGAAWLGRGSRLLGAGGRAHQAAGTVSTKALGQG